MNTPDAKPVPMCAEAAVSIDQMPASRELDALVAEKVMGLKWDEKRCRHCGWPLVEEGKGPGCWPSNCSERPMRHGEAMADRPAHYSTNTEAAWLLVDHLRSQGYALDSYSSGNGEAGHPWTDAAFLSPRVEAFSRAETFSLAVCRAALMVVSR